MNTHFRRIRVEVFDFSKNNISTFGAEHSSLHFCASIKKTICISRNSGNIYEIMPDVS